jgi:hypothetical protein
MSYGNCRSQLYFGRGEGRCAVHYFGLKVRRTPTQSKRNIFNAAKVGKLKNHHDSTVFCNTLSCPDDIPLAEELDSLPDRSETDPRTWFFTPNG